MLMGILGHIGNAEEDGDRVAQSIVGTLRAALPVGGQNDALRKYNESGADPYRVLRPTLGYIVVRQAFSRADGLAIERRWWSELENTHGIRPDDRSSWRQITGDLKSRQARSHPGQDPH